MSPIDKASRHLGGSLPGVDDPWTCPRCSAENQTPLAQGCPICGSGKPGYKAPVESTPAFAAMKEKLDRAVVDLQQQANWEATAANPFEQWLNTQPPMDTAGQEIARRAFMAGMEYGAGRGKAPAPEPEPPWPTAAELVGTPETRTVIAALELFIEQVLQHAPEETTSGEWLTAEEARKLITRIQKEGL